MRSILVTAFEPFGGESINPTGLILKALPDFFRGIEIKKLLLPVEFRRAPMLAAEVIDRISPSAVLMFGQAGGRAAVTPERVAVNIMDARIPDNAGFMPVDEPVVSGGAAAYFSTLPIKQIAERLKSDGLPSEVSNTAGTYVCNALMYSVLHHIRERALKIPAGFIHFPYIGEQAQGKQPSPPFMELADEVAAAEELLKIAAEL